MRRHSLFLFQCFLLIMLWAVAFCSPFLASAESSPEAPFRRLRENVERIELDNGLRVILYRRPSPGVFSSYVWVKVGGVDEKPGITGIAHFLEHMAFKGTETVGTRDFDRERDLLPRFEQLSFSQANGGAVDKAELDSLKQQLEQLWVPNEFSRLYLERGGQGINAGTSKDYTNYTVDLPSSALEFWCWMESERLLRPVFRQFAKEREVVIEERRMRFDDSPDGLLYEKLLATAYTTHPNRLPVIGYLEDLRRIRVEQVQEFRDIYYRPDNIVLALVGDLDPAAVRVLLQRYFGRLKRPRTPLPVVEVQEPRQGGERSAKVVFDAEPSLMVAYHKPTFPDSDDASLSLIHAYLAEGRSSVLHRELVLERQLATAVSTGEGPGERFNNLFIVEAVPRKGVSTSRLRDQIQVILDRIKQQPIEASELDILKRRVRVDLLTALNSNHGIAGTLGRSELLFGDWQALFRVYDQILSTTPADLQRIARRYFDRSNRTYVYLEKKPRLETKQQHKQGGGDGSKVR